MKHATNPASVQVL